MGARGKRPVINVSWDDAVCYTQWLNNRIGWLNKQTNKKFRLPTEAEWEYAARAGTTEQYWWGNKMEQQKAVCSDCDSDWRGKNKGKKTAEVDDPIFESNHWGLYHTSGNVYESVQDCWHESYKGAPEMGDISWVDKNDGDCQRVIRGGSWYNKPRDARSAYRNRGYPYDWYDTIGFRLAQD